LKAVFCLKQEECHGGEQNQSINPEFCEEIINQVQQLKDKYGRNGQDLGAYLDGLILFRLFKPIGDLHPSGHFIEFAITKNSIS